MRALWVNNDIVFELDRLRNTLFDEVDTGASVLLTLLEDDKTTPVAGDNWPKTMQHVADGRYVYSLSTGAVYTIDNRYYARIDVTGSAGEEAQWTLKCIAKVRDG